MAAVAKRLAHLTRHRANDGSELSSNPLRHRFDAVAVHLLQAPKHPVRGFEHALERVAATVLAPQGRLLLFGAGDPIYAAVTNFSVVPFVAYLPDPVESFVHDQHELEGVLAIPLDRLLDDSEWMQSDEPWRFRYLAHEESVVWGLTERIVYGLAPRLRQALAEGQRSDQPAAEL